jgi:hypothetical protein
MCLRRPPGERPKRVVYVRQGILYAKCLQLLSVSHAAFKTASGLEYLLEEVQGLEYYLKGASALAYPLDLAVSIRASGVMVTATVVAVGDPEVPTCNRYTS